MKCALFLHANESINIPIPNLRYPSHRLILCRSSEVFDRMLSQKWNGDKRVSERQMEMSAGKSNGAGIPSPLIMPDEPLGRN
jgi:hypothetical protein